MFLKARSFFNKGELFGDKTDIILSNHLKNEGRLESNSDLTIKTKSFNNDSIITSQSDIDIEATGSEFKNNTLHATGKLKINTDKKVKTIADIKTTGELTGLGGLFVKARSFFNSGDVKGGKTDIILSDKFENDGTIGSELDLKIISTGFENRNTISSNKNISIDSKGTTFKNKILDANDKLTIIAKDHIINNGFLIGVNDLSVNAKSLSNHGDIFGGVTTITLTDKFENKGHVQSEKNMTIISNKFDNQNIVASKSNLAIKMKGKEFESERLHADGVLSIDSSYDFINKGALTGLSSVILNVKSLVNMSTILGGKVNLIIKTHLRNKGHIQSSDRMAINAKNIVNQGILLSDNQLNINADIIENQSIIESKSDMVLEALNEIKNTNHGLIYSDKNLEMSASKRILNHESTLLAKDNLLLDNGKAGKVNKIDNLSGVIKTIAGDITLKANKLNNQKSNLDKVINLPFKTFHPQKKRYDLKMFIKRKSFGTYEDFIKNLKRTYGENKIFTVDETKNYENIYNKLGEIGPYDVNGGVTFYSSSRKQYKKKPGDFYTAYKGNINDTPIKGMRGYKARYEVNRQEINRSHKNKSEIFSGKNLTLDVGHLKNTVSAIYANNNIKIDGHFVNNTGIEALESIINHESWKGGRKGRWGNRRTRDNQEKLPLKIIDTAPAIIQAGGTISGTLSDSLVLQSKRSPSSVMMRGVLPDKIRIGNLQTKRIRAEEMSFKDVSSIPRASVHLFLKTLSPTVKNIQTPPKLVAFKDSKHKLIIDPKLNDFKKKPMNLKKVPKLDIGTSLTTFTPFKRPKIEVSKIPEPNLTHKPKPNLEKRPERIKLRRPTKSDLGRNLTPNIPFKRPNIEISKIPEPNLTYKPQPTLEKRPEEIVIKAPSQTTIKAPHSNKMRKAVEEYLSESIPTFKSMYRPAPPDASVVFETRSHFLDESVFFGSDYFFDRLGVSPHKAIKSLGSPAFEHDYIQQQILEQSGRAFLDPKMPHSSEQIKRLMEEGARFMKARQLSPNIEISPKLLENLEHDMVIYETYMIDETAVSMPVLYLSNATKSGLGAPEASAMIANKIDLTLGGDFINDHAYIESHSDTHIKARNIVNDSGIFKSGGKLMLHASGDLSGKTHIDRFVSKDKKNKGTIRDRQSRFESKGDMSLSSQGRTILNGALIKSGGEASISGRQGVHFISDKLESSFERKAKRHEEKFQDTDHVITEINALKKVSVSSPEGGIYSRGLTVSSKEGTIDITSKEEQVHEDAVSTHYAYVHKSKKGSFGRKSSNTTESQKITSKGLLLESKKGVDIKSEEGDITLVGAHLDSGEGEIKIDTPKGAPKLLASEELDFYSSVKNKKGFVTRTIKQKGKQHKTYRETTFSKPPIIHAKDQLIAEIKRGGRLGDKSLEEQLKHIDHVKFIEVHDAIKDWNKTHRSLTPEAGLIVAVAITVATFGSGIGAAGVAAMGIENGAIAIAVEAGINAAVAEMAIQSVNHVVAEGGLKGIRKTFQKDSLKTIAMTTSKAALTAGGSKGTSGSGFLSKTSDHMIVGLNRAITNTAVDATIGGQKLDKAFKDNIKTVPVDAVASTLVEKIGDARHSGDLQTVPHKALHAGVAASAAKLTGEDSLSAAAGAVIGEITAETMIDMMGDTKPITPKQKERIKGTSKVIAGVSTGLLGGEVNTAANASEKAVENNALGNVVLAVGEKKKLKDYLDRQVSSGEIDPETAEALQAKGSLQYAMLYMDELSRPAPLKDTTLERYVAQPLKSSYRIGEKFWNSDESSVTSLFTKELFSKDESVVEKRRAVVSYGIGKGTSALGEMLSEGYSKLSDGYRSSANKVKVALPDVVGSSFVVMDGMFYTAPRLTRDGAELGAKALGASPGVVQDAGSIAPILFDATVGAKGVGLLKNGLKVGKVSKISKAKNPANVSAIPAAKDVKTPYNAHTWRGHLEQKYPGKVTSTTVPPKNAPNVKLRGKAHPKTDVPFDLKGYPMFDEYIKYQTKIPASQFKKLSYEAQMRAATKDLAKQIKKYPQLKKEFTPEALKAIKSGKAKIPKYTWHHHQESGKMQLVKTKHHSKTGHIGSEAMSKGK